MSSCKMLTRVISADRQRYHSTQRDLRLWVKHEECPSTKVFIKGCVDIDDVAKRIRRKLNTKCLVAVYTSLEKEALCPGLAINDLLKSDLKNNSDESPLFVKLIPNDNDFVEPKTIYIGSEDYDGNFTGNFTERTVGNNHDLMKLLGDEDAQGLVHVSSPNKLLFDFEDIDDLEEYLLFKFPKLQCPPKTIRLKPMYGDCSKDDGRITFTDNETLRYFYRTDGSAFYHVSNPTKRITKLKHLIDGEMYGLFSRHEKDY